MTTTEESALVGQILTRPADDTPRLVYADWLDDHGQTDRAEFVRVQCEITREYPGHNDHPEYASEDWHRRDVAANGECHGCQLLDRQRLLWAVISPAFAAPTDRLIRRPRTILVSYPLAPAVTYWLGHQTRPGVGPEDELNLLVRRGFVSEIRLPLAVFLAHARDLFAAHPITAVVLTDRESWVNHDRTHWGWWLDNPAIHAPAPDSLPRPLADAMADDPTRYDYGIGVRYLPGGPAGGLLFRSADAAHKALSAACVSYGRERAGLPPLE